MHILTHLLGWIFLTLSLSGSLYLLLAAGVVWRFMAAHAPLATQLSSVTLLKPLHFDSPGLEEDQDDAGVGALDDAGDAAAGDAGSTPSWYLDRSLEHVVRPTVVGLDAEVSVRATSCWVAVTAWYDANGNNVVDADEPVAAIPATLISDRGLCMGNLTTVGPIALK